MPADQLWNDIWTTIGGGIFLIVIAFVLRKLLPTWTWLRAAVMLAGGIVVIRLMAYILGTAIANKDDTGWLQDGFHWAARQFGMIPAAGGLFQVIVDKIGTNLTWVVAAVFIVWALVHMFPRMWHLRRQTGRWGRGGAEAAERDRVAAAREVARGGVATRTATRAPALHAARHHTMWVALLAPAAIALVPPLAAAWNMGGTP